MASLLQASDRHTIVTTGWTNPSNAFATATDGVYATAAPGKNSTINGDFGFPALNIPPGSTIVSVVLSVDWLMSAAVTGATLGIQGRNNNVADSTAEVTKTSIAEAVSTFTFGTVPSRADLLVAGRVVGRVRCSKGNTSSAMTGSVDYVSMTVTYTPPALNVTTETDTAVALSRVKGRALAVTTETDTPVALTRTKSRAIATVTETDTPLALTGRKSRTLGITTETDAAQPITRQGHLQAVGTVAETDTAVALGRSKSRALATVTESDSTVALGRAKSRAVTTTTETDTVVSIVGRKIRALSSVTETDTALGVTRTKARTLTPATESDAVVAFGRSKLRALAVVQETDLAVPITSGGHVVAVGTVTETDAAQGFVRTKSRALATVTETDAVVPVVAVKTRGLAVVNETDFAVSITAPIQLGPQNSTTTPTRWGGNGSRQRANGASSGRTRGHGSSGQSGAE